MLTSLTSFTVLHLLLCSSLLSSLNGLRFITRHSFSVKVLRRNSGSNCHYKFSAQILKFHSKGKVTLGKIYLLLCLWTFQRNSTFHRNLEQYAVLKYPLRPSDFYVTNYSSNIQFSIFCYPFLYFHHQMVWVLLPVINCFPEVLRRNSGRNWHCKF